MSENSVRAPGIWPLLRKKNIGLHLLNTKIPTAILPILEKKVWWTEQSVGDFWLNWSACRPARNATDDYSFFMNLNTPPCDALVLFRSSGIFPILVMQIVFYFAPSKNGFLRHFHLSCVLRFVQCYGYVTGNLQCNVQCMAILRHLLRLMRRSETVILVAPFAVLLILGEWVRNEVVQLKQRKWWAFKGKKIKQFRPFFYETKLEWWSMKQNSSDEAARNARANKQTIAFSLTTPMDRKNRYAPLS
jgi:hypothetical protein